MTSLLAQPKATGIRPPASGGTRVLFALPGLHRINRGAETAFESVARELARLDGFEVTLLGSGEARAEEPYRFLRSPCICRHKLEWIPEIRRLRGHGGYEEITFLPGALWRYQPGAYDVTVACTYPYMNWLLRGRRARGRRPAHLYVTQNGDFPAYCPDKPVKRFHCDGLVCTNPEYFARNCDRWPARLIPNGVDPRRFTPGPRQRALFNLPEDVPVVLMVSALDRTKRVVEGVEAAALVPNVHVVVAGDGALRREVEDTGRRLLGARFQRLTVPRQQMPELYRCADAMLHMSQVEPSANAYIEALATGLPIVTHDRDVTRWTFEDQALLVDTGDPRKVAAALQHALTQNQAEQQQARRALAQRRFAWSSIARAYADFIGDILAGRAVAAPHEQPQEQSA